MSKLIKVSVETHKRLNDYKVHPRESFEDVIIKSLNGELDDKNLKEIEEVLNESDNDE